ncbi:MAG TPA: hypothetical protein P5056_03555, partial [Candidatus Paceibacterota bacterium]|nr:hypothetical protein [Candidatus Paceibacterota bacterium]
AGELNSFRGATNSDFETYAKGLVVSLKPYARPDLPNEGDITLSALESGDADGLKNVLLMAQIHYAIANELKTLKVPEEIKFRHLFLINNIETLSYADGLMVNAFDDPKMGIEAVNLYQSATKGLMNSLADINDFFKTKGIVFSQDEKLKIYINTLQ